METKTTKSTPVRRVSADNQKSAIDTSNVFNAWINHGHIEGAGEDSDPFILVAKNKSCAVLGAFDGMGGAGSAVRTLPDGTTHTDAYLASRFVKDTVVKYLGQGGRFGNPIDEIELAEYIKSNLDSYKEKLGIVAPKLKSSMSKILPTTMAMLSWKAFPKGIEISSYWAGDSRNYIMTADGLMQATCDHVRGGGDAMYNLHNDPPMTNAICQSSSFYISKLRLFSDSPAIMISCTDGCFGYVQSPMHFEKLLLDTLFISDDVVEWVKNINDVLRPISGDDYSIAISMVGLPFVDWKNAMKRRYKVLVETITTPYEIYSEQLKAIPPALDGIWETYKESYEHLVSELIPNPDEDGAK